MPRFDAVARAAATLVLLGLLLAACRIPEVPTTVYPAVASYPGPQLPAPTAGPTAIHPTPRPTVPQSPASPAPTTAAAPAGEVAFTVTILHTGEVAGEVVPCG